MPTIELLFDAPDTPPGVVVGAVQIVDDRLVTVVDTVVTSGTSVPVELPEGRYFAQGWLPSGDRIWATFEATQPPANQPTVLRRQRHRAGTSRGPRQAPPGSAVGGWLRGWRFSGRIWSPDLPARLLDFPMSTLDVVVSPRGGALSCAVQLAGGGTAPTIVIVPADVPLRLCPPEGADPVLWRVSLPPGIESTLLAYLHRGDVSSAHIIARAALAAAQAPGGASNPLLDIAVGYYLLRTGHSAADTWIPALIWTHPDSVDATVLHACHRMRDPQATDQLIRDELVRAASGGLPVLAEGLRLLVAGLTTVGNDPVTTASLDRLRPYLAALVDGPLTAFAGIEPSRPQRRPSAWHLPPPAGAVTFVRGSPIDAVPGSESLARESPGRTATGPVRLTDDGNSPADAASAKAARGLLREALHILQARGLGTGRQYEQVTVESLLVEATVRDGASTGLVDVELTTRRLAGARTPPLAGTTISLGVGPTLYCLATFDPSGRCSIPGVPLGNWNLALRDRPQHSRLGVRSVPLPLPTGELVLAASSTDSTTEVMRVLTPDRRTLLVLRRQSFPAYFLELSRSAGTTSAALGVEYSTTSGGTALRVVPLPAATSGGRTSSTIRIDDIDIHKPWHLAETLDQAYLAACPLDDLMASVRVTVSAGTRRAWRALAAELAPTYRQAIEQQLVRDAADKNPARHRDPEA